MGHAGHIAEPTRDRSTNCRVIGAISPTLAKAEIGRRPE